MSRQIAEMKDPDLFRSYYRDNEPYIDNQWSWYVWPHIKDFDLSHVLDVACGQGRNARKFLEIARCRNITLLDINREAIEICRQRFANHPETGFRFIVADGLSLAGVPDQSISLVYSWDSMVHFDLDVIAAYFAEFARVLQPGGHGFIHHSHYGAKSDVSDNWKANPGWRSNVSAQQVEAIARTHGLEVSKQFFIEWDYVKDSDCVTIFSKP